MPRRRTVVRHRTPLRWRLVADPVGTRRRLAAIAVTAAVALAVGRTVSDADRARTAWGTTSTVWVADHEVAAGDRLSDAVVQPRPWPRALVPPDALRHRPGSARAAGPIDPGRPLTQADVRRTAARALPANGRALVALDRGEHPLPVRPGDHVAVWATTDPALADPDAGPVGARTSRVVDDARVSRVDPARVVIEVARPEVADLADALARATITIVGTR